MCHNMTLLSVITVHHQLSLSLSLSLSLIIIIIITIIRQDDPPARHL